MGEKIGDWIFENMGWCALGMIFLFFVLLFAVAADAGKRQQRFMSECQQDRNRYECEAMWRAGESRSTYIPVVIPVR